MAVEPENLEDLKWEILAAREPSKVERKCHEIPLNINITCLDLCFVSDGFYKQ